MSNTNNFQSIKETIANIRKAMSSSDNTDPVTAQHDTDNDADNEVLNLENPENSVELHNIQHVHNTLNEINHTFQAITDLPTTTYQNKPDIQVSVTKEKIYPEQLSNVNQFISIEQSTQRLSSQERRLTTTHTLSEEVSKIDNSSEIKGIHQQNSFITENLVSPESIVASSEEIKKLITQIHHYTKPPNISSEKSPTVEELVINMLKPELSTWLNNNLQKLVKEIVEKEIKHIIKKSNQS
ncbi:hypothetical protein ECHHL_0141 [Ehrlichia chaffeensis str. Heartland]|uniref:DUF2497 domain-containing protein n=1 Tax=Ehrlichia chaffeensis TaxID=945 RepID=UPI000053DBF9|nr:DUF2497 domain-containing protein [Ehrlichia chaffeensis]AHX03316.1 hypothetical protein ECHHL_0141 [Ehrlichia chaffeensis str. Heartland]AHX08791.1 hypothetical protein ECHSTV_0142 [Ehrlichia chaffeensis str. Saint Vincent]AHX10171.1 hypothetical protein ECHWP_0138 [Ehrlichia chaffeensis str. West Paces]